MQQHRRADTDRHTLHRGHQRPLAASQRMQEADDRRSKPRGGGRRLQEFLKIVAGRKRARRAGNHQAAHLRVARGALDCAGEGVIHRRGQSVLFFRTIHPHDADWAFVGDDNVVAHAA
jgi:hypothetical protein